MFSPLYELIANCEGGEDCELCRSKTVILDVFNDAIKCSKGKKGKLTDEDVSNVRQLKIAANKSELEYYKPVYDCWKQILSSCIDLKNIYKFKQLLKGIQSSSDRERISTHLNYLVWKVAVMLLIYNDFVLKRSVTQYPLELSHTDDSLIINDTHFGNKFILNICNVKALNSLSSTIVTENIYRPYVANSEFDEFEIQRYALDKVFNFATAAEIQQKQEEEKERLAEEERKRLEQQKLIDGV